MTHGNPDMGKSSQELTDKAKTSKVFVTCGTVSSWAHSILSAHGFKSRVVAASTLDRHNTYDNGHVLLEVYRTNTGKWVLYDLDQNRYFAHQGRLLSLVEFSGRSRSGDYEMKLLAGDTPFDLSPWIYQFTSDALVLESGLRRWYKRVMQVPSIHGWRCLDAANLDVTDPIRRANAERYSKSAKCLDKEQFIKKFYGPVQQQNDRSGVMLRRV